MLRPATLDDLDPLVALEERCFDSDRMSRRSFRRMITRANAALLVDRDDGVLRGYALVLFHAGSSLARLYSLAVDPEHRGKGIARALLAEAERVANERDCVDMRLELRRDNRDALALYESAGYRQFDVQADYYEDHMDAIRMEKSLVPPLPSHKVRVPYYEQTLDFTCGPAAILMAMHAQDRALAPSRKLELRIWREATTVYMTSGHGGCGPYGLALSAHHRGYDVEVWIDGEPTELLVGSVRSEDKKAVIRLVQQDSRLEELVDEVGRANLVLVHATKDPARAIDLKQLVDHLQLRGLGLRGTGHAGELRDILRGRLADINGAFQTAIAQHQYEGKYFCVYPIKVNQQRQVVEEVLDFGRPYGFGLEAGSKPELLAVVAMASNDTPIICNGFKDAEFIETAMLALKMGRRIIPVVEKYTELELILEYAAKIGVRPQIGMRVKLASRGGGRWQSSRGSSGGRSMFGGTRRTSGGRADNPEVKSRGGFGRDKD